MSKLRGFEAVSAPMRKVFGVKITEEAPIATIIDTPEGKKKVFLGEVKLPQRADACSAGYDFYSPMDVILLPAQKTLLYTDVKAYMQIDERLSIYPRSSMGVKQGLMLSNTVGIVDASYYDNAGNEGNIALALLNTSGVAIKIKKGDRIAQGIFEKYLITDDDAPLAAERVGGLGSSGV
jgi:dUTP pyrophosphatase